MNIKTWQANSYDGIEAFVQFMELLGCKPGSSLELMTARTETVVSTERESPYIFGKRLRLAAGCPESDGYPYAAVNITDGVYWVQGDNGRFAIAQSLEILKPGYDHSFINRLETFVQNTGGKS